MSQLWSEYNKVVNALEPVADAFDSTKYTDILDLEGYKKCTFLVPVGTSSTGTTRITVQAGVSSTSAATAIVYKYRTQITGTGGTTGSTGSDVPGTLTDATTTGFLTTTAKPGGMYIIEVDASTVAAAGTDYDHCRLKFVEAKNSPVTGCVVAVLSEPRYPQAILDSAIV